LDRMIKNKMLTFLRHSVITTKSTVHKNATHSLTVRTECQGLLADKAADQADRTSGETNLHSNVNIT